MFSKPKTSQKMRLTLLFILSWLCLSASASALDITRILGQHPELSTFSNYLTQTQLTHDINSRQSITLLAIANSDIRSLSGKPMDQIKNIMAVHVLLGYYDLPKLKKLRGNTLIVPTLLHSNSMNITITPKGTVAFGSARAKLVRTVESDPYTVSVMQINNPVIPSGLFPAPRRPIRTLTESPAPSPSQSGDHNKAPPPSPSNGSAPSQSPKNSDSNAPEQQQNGNAPSPSNSDDKSKNAPQPSPSYNNNNPSPSTSPPPKSSAPPPDSSAPAPSDDDSSSPPPQDDSADAPDDSDSPPSSSLPKGDDAPSSAPASDSPSPGGDGDTPPADKKSKNSAGGMSPSSAGWIGAVVISVMLGKLT